MGNRFKCAAAIGILIFVQAFTAVAQPAPSSAPVAQGIQIGPGDLIEVTVFGQNDLTGRFRVNEKGDVLVPLLGSLHVAGMTADEIAMNLNDRYIQGEILTPGQAHVTVFVSEYATQGIRVNGEVKSPGVYPALGVRMLYDVLSAAGGLTLTASSKITITHKNAPESPMTVEYDPEATPPTIPQVQILPGDTIMVPRAGIVYVAGNVAKTGGYILEGERPLTIEKLMALVGGGGHGAGMDHAHLVRTLANGSREDIEFSVNRIFKGRAPDIVLKDGDILYVPTSRIKLVTEQAIGSAVGLGTSLLLYRVAVQ